MKGIVIKLYPTKKQREQINKTIGCCRFLYNQMLAERIENYKNGIKDKPKTEKQYKEVFPFLKEASSRGLQQSRIDLESAYKNFFRRVKNGDKKVGFPRFKSKHNSTLSYREPQLKGCISIEGNYIKLLKLGLVKFKGKIEGEIRNVVIKANKDGTYTASVLVDNYKKESFEQKRTGSVGVDLGLKHLAITSNGNFYKHIDKNSKSKSLQKHMSRKVVGSKRYNKTKKKLNRLNKKQYNKTKHFHYHVIKDIISENQTVCIEKLDIKGMMKNKVVSSSFQEKSIGQLRTRLLEKCSMLGVDVIVGEKYFTSSKTCSNCGCIKKDLKLSDRIYKCVCGLSIDRDFNASLNLKALSGEYSDYRHGENVSLIEKSFDFNSSKFLGSVY